GFPEIVLFRFRIPPDTPLQTMSDRSLSTFLVRILLQRAMQFDIFILAIFLLWTFFATPINGMTIVHFSLGSLTWLNAEYLVHRFILHAPDRLLFKPLFYHIRYHARHHLDPTVRFLSSIHLHLLQSFVCRVCC